MKITCPQCEFSREVAKEKMPSGSFMATCPQCQHRFKIENNRDTLRSDASSSNNEHKPKHGDSFSQQNTTNSSPQQASQNKASQQENKDEHKANPLQQQVQNHQEHTSEQTENTAQEHDPSLAFALENPWDSPEKYGYFSAFYQTVMRILFSAPRFFFGLTAQSPMQRAFLFYCIISILQITFERFWGGVISASLTPLAANDPNLQVLLTFLNPKGSYLLIILLGTAFSIIELIFSAAIFTLLFNFIASDKGSYGLFFQIVAYSSAPMLLCVVPLLGSGVGFVWSIATTLIGCRYALRLDWPRTLLGVLPIYIIGLYIALKLMTGW